MSRNKEIYYDKIIDNLTDIISIIHFSNYCFSFKYNSMISFITVIVNGRNNVN